MSTTQPPMIRRKLKFNPRDTERFIAALDSSVSTVWNFRCIPETQQCRARAARIFAAGRRLPRMKFRGSFVQHAETLRRRNTQGFAIYYSLNVMNGGVKADHCTAVRAIPLDLDNSPLPETWARDIKPHIIVETSPDRYQCLFLIHVCQEHEMAAAEDIGRRLAVYYGGDPSVADRARVLRLPGFVHQKGRPFTSRTKAINLGFNPSDFVVDQYDLADFKFLPKLAKRSAPANALGTISATRAKLLFEHYPIEALRGNHAWRTFAMALHSACRGDDEVAELFFEFCMTDPTYGEADDARNRMRWDSFSHDKAGGLTIGTLRKLCYEARLPAAVRFGLFNNAVEDFSND